VERTGIFINDETSQANDTGVEGYSQNKTLEILDTGAACCSFGGDKVTISHKEGISIGKISGKEKRGPVEIIKLTIEGDHSYVAGGIIVHNTEICIAYDGASWDLDGNPIDGNELPYDGGTPRHWNCRSVEVPITKTFRELGINMPEPSSDVRASSEGPTTMTMTEYLDSRTKAQLDEQLGVGRADLYRAGTITRQQLLDLRGNPLSLAELQAKYL
jgi:hypothetical protein